MSFKKSISLIIVLLMALSTLLTGSVWADSSTNPEPMGTLDTAIKFGDVDNDGKIGVNDALTILKMAVNIASKQTINSNAADLNKDGQVSVRDALLLLKDMAGLGSVDYTLGIENISDVGYYVPEMYTDDHSFLTEKAVGFYGADGYGKYTSGGRGGRVIEVTNLNDSGEGSLRAACEASGPRIVVFKVSGTINAKNGIRITNPDITIAGETAPGDGITIASNALTTQADNVIIRYIRFRTGDQLNAWGLYTGGEYGVDALTVSGHNVIIDHCDASWGTDETLSVVINDMNNPTDNISIQWSIVSESLVYSANVGRRLGLASLVSGASGTKYSFHHNIYACHASRMPDLANSCTCGKCVFNFEFYNNVVYNWQGSSAGKCAALDEAGETLRKVDSDFVGNTYISGPESTGNYAYSEAVYGNSFYAEGNVIDGEQTDAIEKLVHFEDDCRATDRNPYFKNDPEKYYDYDHLAGFWRTSKLASSIMNEPQPAEDAKTDVLLYAGSSRSRDTLDTGLIEGIINKTARCINFPFEAAGWANEQPAKNTGREYGDWLIANYPTLASYDGYADSDHDGMSDSWEDFMGLDKNNVEDAKASYKNSEYTNLDVFLQFLIENPVAAIKQ